MPAPFAFVAPLLPALLAALLVAPLPAGAAAPEPAFIYGSELMNARERERFRRELQQHGDEVRRGEFRERHRERMRQRAQRRGVELDDGSGTIRRRDGEAK